MLGLHEKWRATFIESWPDEVCELGLPFEQLLISEQDRVAIGSRTAAFRDLFSVDELPQLSDEFRVAIDAKTAVFKEGAHFRFGGCSFKQPGQYQKGPIFNSAQLMSHILRDNPRVAGLLASSLQDKFDVCMFIRPWKDIPKWSEFRLFMKNREFIGASQYFHTAFFPEIEANAKSIAGALVDFADRFREVAHIDDAIVDIYLKPDDVAGFEAVLLDINPLIVRSDPCLFQWRNGGDFDRGLRFRGGNNRVLAIAPLPFAHAA
ncbi:MULTISPECIES: hypothetical protein [Rhizobium/Agrobacterium group]|uniref:hypothetical protein n=1 Tax=Rhizobium/Agrobacterium group TaxID=227290 RepID=UPI0010CBF829|nr:MULTISPECIES: hypothetical protein [Rhizobium/Agrobacterium group]MCZ4071879.1 hypothetical protein [Agrobacterium sp. LMR679]TKV71268.1 hypothetical protein D0C28_22960 [Rhizobium sp. AU243]